jgi:hypothetical protein
LLEELVWTHTSIAEWERKKHSWRRPPGVAVPTRG